MIADWLILMMTPDDYPVVIVSPLSSRRAARLAISIMQPARGLPTTAPLPREIAHVRSDLRPSRTRPWPRTWPCAAAPHTCAAAPHTCAAAWPEPWKALAHEARRQSNELRLGQDVVLLEEVHLHAAVLVGVASAEQVVAGAVVLRVADLGRDPKSRAPTRYVGGASRRGRPADTLHRG
jgi:hypothetical protein